MSDWKERVHPDLQGMLRKIPSLTFTPWKVRVIRFLERYLVPASPLWAGTELREVMVGTQQLRLLQPIGGPRVPAAFLWIHGGGRVVGDPKGNDGHCSRIAAELGIVVAATSYRLAPQHTYPAALDDCAAAWRWLHENAAALGIDPARIAIGGESAGGGLAAELAQRLYDEGGIQPRGQLLIYPMLDDRTATDPTLTAKQHPVWNNTSNHLGWSSYLGKPPGSPDIGPYAAAARRADLAGLPPTWLTVGDLDLFYAEDMDYLDRLAQAGVETTRHVIPGGFHGYFAMGRDEPPIQETWTGLLAFLRGCLAEVSS